MADNIPEDVSTQVVEDFRITQEARRNNEVRPPTDNDKAEREQVFRLVLEAAAKVPPNIPLRFHGCHSYDFEGIVQSKMLQSGADTIGQSTSFDARGEISSTTPKTVIETIGDIEGAKRLSDAGKEIKRTGYIDMLDTEIPLGPTFVLMPQDKDEANKGENGGNVMNNVDLQSQQFVRVLVSDEFYNRGKGIMMMHGLDPNKVIRYTEFSDAIPEISEEVKKNFPYTEEYQPLVQAPGLSINL